MNKKSALIRLLVLILLLNFTLYPGINKITITVSDVGGNSANDSITLNYAAVFVNDDASSSWYDEFHVATIQEGINKASDNYIVVVYDGTY